jgi:hypothetical protein
MAAAPGAIAVLLRPGATVRGSPPLVERGESALGIACRSDALLSREVRIADDLPLSIGRQGRAISKASHVMVGVQRSRNVAGCCPQRGLLAMMRRAAITKRGRGHDAASAGGGTAWEVHRSNEKPPGRQLRPW